MWCSLSVPGDVLKKLEALRIVGIGTKDTRYFEEVALYFDCGLNYHLTRYQVMENFDRAKHHLTESFLKTFCMWLYRELGNARLASREVREGSAAILVEQRIKFLWCVGRALWFLRELSLVDAKIGTMVKGVHKRIEKRDAWLADMWKRLEIPAETVEQFRKTFDDRAVV